VRQFRAACKKVADQAADALEAAPEADSGHVTINPERPRAGGGSSRLRGTLFYLRGALVCGRGRIGKRACGKPRRAEGAGPKEAAPPAEQGPAAPPRKGSENGDGGDGEAEVIIVMLYG